MKSETLRRHGWEVWDDKHRNLFDIRCSSRHTGSQDQILNPYDKCDVSNTSVYNFADLPRLITLLRDEEIKLREKTLMLTTLEY